MVRRKKRGGGSPPSLPGVSQRAPQIFVKKTDNFWGLLTVYIYISFLTLYKYSYLV